MSEIISRHKIPLLVGGTMLYFRALQDGLSELPSADPQLRHKLEQSAAALGWPALHQRLIELDPDTAARIKPTDSQRIQRALEVCLLTQQPMSRMLKAPKQTNFPYDTVRIALSPSDRSQLHQRIAQRFDKMLSSGLVEEVESIRQQFPALRSESPSMRCVGYRQAYLYLDQQIDARELRETGIAATRQLAKRQLTWLRSMKNDALQEFDCLSADASVKVRSFLQQRLSNRSL